MSIKDKVGYYNQVFFANVNECLQEA